MGGRGGSGTRNSSRTQVYNMEGFIGLSAVERAVSDELNHNLGPNEEYASVINVSILSTPEQIEENGGYAEVEASYSVSVRVPYTEVDDDGISHTYYEDDTEYHSRRFNIIVIR